MERDNATEVEFYYAIESRYSYLAARQLEAIASRTEATFLWRPLGFFDLLEIRGKNPFQGDPVSEQYEFSFRTQDAQRWASYYGVPFQEPRGRVTYNPREFAIALLVAEQMGALPVYSHSLFAALYAENWPAIDLEFCAERSAAVGLDVAAFRRELNRADEWQAIAHQRAITAAEKGVSGVPTFIVGNEKFWGNDRPILLEHHLQQQPS